LCTKSTSTPPRASAAAHLVTPVSSFHVNGTTGSLPADDPATTIGLEKWVLGHLRGTALRRSNKQ
jgi:hypothetical protein